MTKEFSKSYSSEKYSVNSPVPGFLVLELSLGKVLSKKTLSKTTPSFSKDFKIKLCTGQKVSSGKTAVPRPS